MSEELIQRGLDRKNPTSKIGKWDYFSIGATTLKALKNASIIRNVDYGVFELKKVDGIIIHNKDVIAIIEFKHPKDFKTKIQKDKAIIQEIEVAKILGSKIIIATDTIDTIWVNALTNKRICDELGNEIKVLFNPSDEHLAALIEKINYSINEKNNNILQKKLVNPTDLAKSIWQDIWSVSGATPENCLYTFVELFIFKYLSDLKILKDIDSFDFLYELKNKRTDDEILQYYADNIRRKIKELFPYNPLDNTTIINGTIFVSKDQDAVSGYSTVFIKVLKKFAEYGKLEHIDYDFKSQLFESFLKESISKKNWGQFFTPIKVIRAIEKMAKDEIKEGAVICDPACGVGKFLLEPIKSKLSQFYTIEGDSVIPKITIRGFDKGFDKDEQKTIILAKANMLIYFSEIIKDYPNHTVQFGKIFNDSFTLKTNSILGTLREPLENKYDLILTNPPYVTSGSSNLKEEISKDSDLKKHYKINAIGVEGLFMEWIIRALKPNGKAFIVVPDGIFNRQNDKNLREFIRQECYIDGIISLPLNTFFTTNKKTYILCITKKNNKADTQIEPVFTYLVSEIGESRDIYRFDIEQNDLNEATALYNFFKGNKSSFDNFNKDPRCKIFHIEKFEPDIYWTIDRWWTKDEKIVLGIEEEDKAVNFHEVPMIIEEIADTLNSFSVMIKEFGEKKKSNLNQNFKIVMLTDIFEIKKGLSKYTNSYFNQCEMKLYDVYSSQTTNNGIVGKIDTFDYDCECLTWTTDGVYAGTVFYRHGKFSMTTHCGALTPKSYENLSLEFLKYQLENILPQLVQGEGNKRVTVDAIKKVTIHIPILSNGDFDIKAQQNIVEKYNLINDLKTKVIRYKETIKNLRVKIDNEYQSFKEVEIGDIFDLSQKTNNSKFTKTFVELNKGSIPVYSASHDENSVNYGYVKDNLPKIKYFENCMTWNIDGSIGKIFKRNGRFSLSEKVIPLMLFKKYQQRLDKLFLKYTIENKLKEENFGFTNKAGKEKISKICIRIPTCRNDSFDMKLQQAISQKYLIIEQIKYSINDELSKLEKLTISI